MSLGLRRSAVLWRTPERWSVAGSLGPLLGPLGPVGTGCPIRIDERIPSSRLRVSMALENHTERAFEKYTLG